MINFLGYNFTMDGNSLDPFPSNVINIKTIKIQNALYDNFFVTKDITTPFNTTPPDEWDIYTIMLATFSNNLNAGSIDLSTSDVDSIRIKRRKVGEFEWITIYEQKINTAADFYFSGEDYFAINDTEYEYAWVPVLAGIEGGYVTQTIESKFSGVFLCDVNTIYKLIARVEYGPTERTQLVGLFNPLGSKYPIYVSNGATNYETGSVTGKLIGNYENTHVFNRKEMVEQREALFNWLTNKKAKIIKDSNSNCWLVFVTGSPSVSYDVQWGNGMMDLSFQWGEVGDSNNTQDMQNVGLLPIIE